ncbi:MAG: hybrid sensor histidine kinase/response regulator [Sideroxydans sp.]|nr:hybrid sensor histidine kinase/response regulator [Sideroxydans sp.]
MRKPGIENQALMVALIPVLIFSLLLESYFIYTRIGEMDRALFDRAKLIVRQMASSSEYAVFSGNLSLLQQQVDVALSQPDVNAVVVLDATGSYLAGSGKSSDYNAILKRTEAVDDSRMLIVQQPIIATQIQLDEFHSNEQAMSKPLGEVILVMSKARLYSEKSQMLLLNVLLTILVMGLAVIVAFRISRSITRPIMGIRAAVNQIGEGRLDTRIGETHVRELNELAHGINEMAQQLNIQRETLQHRIDDATYEMRLKKEEAEKANFDKTRFLAAASHDLRQPMHAMGLFMGELSNRINTPEQRMIVEKVEESVEAMSGLLDSLLDISKLDAGVIVPQEREFALDALLYRLEHDFSQIALKRSITFRMHTLEAAVSSDPILLERILINLIGNAIRYAPEHGIVMVACRKRGEYIRIEVRDNGPGIPAEEQQNVFKEFIQLSNKARDRSKGLGLGLAIVDRLSKLLGHPISLRSAPQRGSTFAIEVRIVSDLYELQAGQKTSLDDVSNLSDDYVGLRVLVVDDDLLVRNGTAGLLSSWGCIVSEAGSLEEVKRFSAEDAFDLVVCDYRLPDGNGLDLADCIDTHCEIKPAFILISGDTSPEVLQEVVAKGHHLLHKPVRPAKLRSMLSFVLKRKTS